MIHADMPTVCAVDEYYSNAQSNEGRATQEVLREISELASASIFLSGVRRELNQELEAVVEEALASDDSEMADALSILLSSQSAKQLIGLFPSTISKPEVSVEKDGEIAFDWINSKDRYFSLSVGNNGYCHYAAIIGPNRHHGKEMIVDVFPETAISFIHKVTG